MAKSGRANIRRDGARAKQRMAEQAESDFRAFEAALAYAHGETWKFDNPIVERQGK